MKKKPSEAGTRSWKSARQCALVALLGIVILVGGAQSAEGDEEQQETRSRTRIVLRISEALDLDEDQTLRFASEYRKLDKRRRELTAQRRVTEVELETAVGRAPQDEARIRELTNQLLTIDKELILLPDTLFESVQPMLDTNQRAKMALLKVKLQRKIDRERNRRKAGRGKGKKGSKKGRAAPGS